ncbi:MAG: hypothetical protein HY908_35580 [Myxococcales bacterium]|nr:hypothetical protein [Myxococcales bacterium]
MRRTLASLVVCLAACSNSADPGRATTTSTTSTTTTTTGTTTTTTTTTGAGGGTGTGGGGGSTTSSTGGNGPGDSCNPVTNEGCAPGEACDASGSKHVFQCYPPPNTKLPCELCGQDFGWCAPTLSCFGGNCARYCCTNEDCGPLGTCDTSPLADFGNGQVGLCLELGAGGGAPGPVCAELPTLPPSAGNCATYGHGTGGAGGAGGSSTASFGG